MNTITKIAFSNDKKNKTRSILIMFAICLTTMLLMIISTIGNGAIRLQKSQAASSYGSNYGMFISVNNTQLHEIKRRAEIADTGIMCIAGILKGNEKGGFVSADTIWVLPEEVYQSMSHQGNSYGYIWVDCANEDILSVEQSLNSLLNDTSNVSIKTYHDELQTAEMASKMMKLGCYLFMAIVGLIGFMNLANTMIINITTKKQEYGVLQAVGMTNKQLNLGLQIQGLIFTIGTIIVALVIGLPCGHMLFSYAKSNRIFGMNVYNIPFVPIVVMIAVVGALQILLSFLLSHNLKKETLVERIRYQE